MSEMLSHKREFYKGIDLPDLEADLCDMLDSATFKIRREVARELIKLWRLERTIEF